MELTTDNIRNEISIWMSSLFDKDFSPEDVRKSVEILTSKITSAQLKQQQITKELFFTLCKQVENDIHRTTETDN